MTAAGFGRGASAIGETCDVVRATSAACAGGMDAGLLGSVAMLPIARSLTLSVGSSLSGAAATGFAGSALSGVETMGLAGGALLGVVTTSWLVVTRGALAPPEFAGARGFTGATGLADTALSPLSLPPPRAAWARQGFHHRRHRRRPEEGQGRQRRMTGARGSSWMALLGMLFHGDVMSRNVA